MTGRKLHEWRGVKRVAVPTGAAVTTRVRTLPGEDDVLDQVAELMGGLRRADLAAVSRPAALEAGLDAGGRHR